MMRCHHRRRAVFVIIVILCLVLLDWNNYNRFLATVYHYATYEYSLSDGNINDSFPIKFYHEAYLDLRTSPSRLRLYSLNPCIRKSNLLLVDVFYESSSVPKRMELHGKPLEDFCPSMYAPAAPCFYQPHFFWTELEFQDVGGINKVEVILGDHRVSLSVKEVAKEREEGLTVCVQPVYYYSQWQNVLLYLEAWRAHGARRFVVFFHSASRETLSVLRHYEALGALELRAWPSFGAPRQEGFPSVDESVFIFSYYLAMNVCLQDVRTSLATVADFDELLVPLEGSLLDYSLAQMRHSNVGALRFESNHVAIHPSIYSNDFSGVASPTFYDRKAGMPKHVFNMSTIDIAEVHHIKSFLDPSKITKSAKGGLLHFRYGVEEKFPQMADPGYRFFPNKTEKHIENIRSTALKIFNGSLPVFNPKLLETMKSCGTEVASQWNQCLTKSGKCKVEMDKLYDWHYDESKEIFKS